MDENKIYKLMEKQADKFGVELTETGKRIAKVRARNKTTTSEIQVIKICPCAPNDKERGCISPKCLMEIMKDGKCHCGAFCKKMLA